MASLSGVSVASSYTSLLKLNGNTDSLVAGDGSNAIQVVDGDGTTSPLFLNTNRIGIGTANVQSPLHIYSTINNTFSDTISSSDFSGDVLTIENRPASSNDDYVSIAMATSGSQFVSSRIVLDNDGSGAGALNFQLRSPGDLSNTTTFMKIKSTGDVEVPSGNILASGASAPSITATDTTNTTSIQMRALDNEVRFGSVTNHPVKIGANSSTTGLVIDTSNNIGIGGDAVTKAGAFGDATTLGVVGTDGSGNGPSIQVAVDTTADARPMSLIFFNKNNSDISGATTKHISGIRSFTVTSDNNASSDSGGDLRFYTKPESGAFDERMRITDTGVGIGNQSPQSKLHIGSRGTASALSPSGDGLIFDFYNIGNPYTRYGTIISNSADASEAKLSLWTTASSSTASEKLCIDGDGTADHKGNYIVNEEGTQNHVANTMSAPYFNFSGSANVHIDVADKSNLEFIHNLSISAWVKNENSDLSASEVIFGKFTPSGNKREYFLSLNTNELVVLGLGTINGASVMEVATNSPISTDKWNHIVAVYSSDGSTGTVSIYVNGVSQAVTAFGSMPSSIPQRGGNPFIGRVDTGGFFQGSISCLRVFNKSLTATEVKEQYSGASVPYKYKGASQTNTLGSLDFTSGWTAVNASITDSDTFASTSANGYIAKDFSAGDVGKQYRLRIAGTVSSGDLQVQNRNGSSNILTGLNGTFDQTTEYTYEGDNDKPIILRLTSSGATADITHLSIVRIGAVAEYDGSGIASDKWFDKSGNDLHGTVSGASVENAPSGDDGLVYEEGTWSPSIGGNATYDSTPVGKYIRIGNVVHISAKILVNAIGTGSTVELSGLPYPNHSDTQATVNINYFSGIGVSTISLAGYIEGSASVIRFSGLATSATTMGAGLAVFTSGSDLYFSATYQV